MNLKSTKSTYNTLSTGSDMELYVTFGRGVRMFDVIFRMA